MLERRLGCMGSGGGGAVGAGLAAPAGLACERGLLRPGLPRRLPRSLQLLRRLRRVVDDKLNEAAAAWLLVHSLYSCSCMQTILDTQ